MNLESISCGTPVVTYRTGGSVEAVTDSTGLIVEQGNVKGLLEAVRAICQRGKDILSKIIQAICPSEFQEGRTLCRLFLFIRGIDEYLKTRSV